MIKNTQCSHVNPLEKVRVGTPFDVEDAQKIASMIVDPDGNGVNDFHQKTSSVLILAVILHVLYAEKDKTLHGVATFLEDTPTAKAAVEKMLDVEHDPEGKYHWKNQRGEQVNVHPIIAQVAKEMSRRSENESSAVFSTAKLFLKPCLNPADQPERCVP